MSLCDRTALIFGASSGIGKSIALGLACKCSKIFLVSSNPQKLTNTASYISVNSSNSCIGTYAADMSNLDQLNISIDRAIDYLGHIDILINNTGGPKIAPYSDLLVEDWDEVYKSLFLSAVIPTSRLCPLMSNYGWGRIITITSTVASEPSNLMILSASMRAGLTTYMKSLSRQVAPYGVTVNTVAPGGVQTSRVVDLAEARALKENIPVEKILSQNASAIPIGRLATPEEFAEYPLFLCDDSASYITGTCVNVDGGLTRSVF